MKNILDFAGYSITEDGKVYSHKRKRFKKLLIDRHGYQYVILTQGDGKSVFRFVHRLVAEAFIANPEGKRTVNHLDGDRLNNCKEYLEWATQSENNTHAYRTGLRVHHKYKQVTQGVMGEAV